MEFNINEYLEIADQLGVTLSMVLDQSDINAWERDLEDGIIEEMIRVF